MSSTLLEQSRPGLRRRRLAGVMPLMALWPWHGRVQASDLTGGDPLGTLQWPDMHREFIGLAPVHFSSEVLVKGPDMAEDALNVPVMVDARPLAANGAAIELIRVVVDRNPIRHVLDYEPLRSLPVIAFRLRLEQASPVRALVRTQDGQWHVGGNWIQAAGGGCTVAGISRTDGSWSRTLNRVQARFFGNLLEGSRRLRIRIMHPMDTGLVAGIPAFHIERLDLVDSVGQVWWRLAIHEPVSENPLLTFELPPQMTGALRLRGQDNNGNRIDALVPA